jgi:hypothetical protein
MELILNLAWAMLAIFMACGWVFFGVRTGPNRRSQLVALAVLILILFPVISVSDDLMALQNPAEDDCCLRRAHVVVSTHSIFPTVAAMPRPVLAELPFGFLRLAAPGNLPVPVICHPGLAAIQNRPPPAA